MPNFLFFNCLQCVPILLYFNHIHNVSLLFHYQLNYIRSLRLFFHAFNLIMYTYEPILLYFKLNHIHNTIWPTFSLSVELYMQCVPILQCFKLNHVRITYLFFYTRSCVQDIKTLHVPNFLRIQVNYVRIVAPTFCFFISFYRISRNC